MNQSVRGESGSDPHVPWVIGMVPAVTLARPTSRTPMAAPLGPAEAARALTVAQRLHGELKRLLRHTPASVAGASALSRHTGVLRVTCQRVVSAMADDPVTARFLVRLPGVEGLRQFLEGMRAAGYPMDDIANAEAAVDEFDRLLREVAGSQSRLAERLGSGQGDRPAEDPASDRRALGEAAWRITGRRCEVALSIYAFRSPEHHGGPAILERALAKGVIGVQLMPGGLPLQLSSGDTLSTDDSGLSTVQTLDQSRAAGRTPEAILAPFTTQPMPSVTARGGAGRLLQVVDPSERTAAPFDVVTALRATSPYFDPQTGRPALHEVWSLVNMPSRRLVLDVYLHQGIERLYRPSIDAQLWNPGLTVPEEQKWATRLSPTPRLQLLGAGVGGAACDSYARHAALTAYFFDRLGWDAGEFVGFRCEVEHPIWRAGYCMSFEYLAGQ